MDGDIQLNVVSADRLDAALAKLELRLSENFRQTVKDEVQPLALRVSALERKEAGLVALEDKAEKTADRRAIARPTLIASAVSAAVAAALQFAHLHG